MGLSQEMLSVQDSVSKSIIMFKLFVYFPILCADGAGISSVVGLKKVLSTNTPVLSCPAPKVRSSKDVLELLENKQKIADPSKLDPLGNMKTMNSHSNPGEKKAISSLSSETVRYIYICTF